MAEREHLQTSKRGTDQKPREHDAKQGVVGNDVPDESKERHTEIAVKIGNKGSERQNQKR